MELGRTNLEVLAISPTRFSTAGSFEKTKNDVAYSDISEKLIDSSEYDQEIGGNYDLISPKEFLVKYLKGFDFDTYALGEEP
jgi:hypothetical protein